MLTFSIDYLTENDEMRQLSKRVDPIRDHIAEGDGHRQIWSPPPMCKNTVTPDFSKSDHLPSKGNDIDSQSSRGGENCSISSSSDSDSTSLDSVESIAEVLLSLDKRIRKFPNKDNTTLSPPSISSDNCDEKPPHSYIALISMAILSISEGKILLGDIYRYIMDNYPYYNNTERAWRNSIRHNLSLNECFIKNGRADNSKGNYWSIHPACVEDFAKGDYRRRQARRRARKTNKDTNLMTFPQGYGCNIGYVPMKSSSIGQYPYQSLTSQLVTLGQQFQSTVSGSPQGYYPYYGITPEMMAWESQGQNPVSCSPLKFCSGNMVYPQMYSHPASSIILPS